MNRRSLLKWLGIAPIAAPLAAIAGIEKAPLADMANLRVRCTQFVDESGHRILSRARQLIISPDFEAVAIRLLKTELRSGIADSDVNVFLTPLNSPSKEFFVMDFFTNDCGA